MKFMIRENCNNCIWQGCCEFTAPCDFFTPNEAAEDDEINYEIEEERVKFRREFNAYLRLWEE